jgi:transcriptional regulator with XRE-family HTH domain
MELLAQNIKKLRKVRNLTQKELAEKLGVDQGHVSKIETGAAKPSKQLIKLICKEFKVREEWFLSGTSDLDSADFTLEEIEDFELNIEKYSKLGLANNLDFLCDIILKITEKLTHFHFVIREIGKPDERLIELKEELKEGLSFLSYNLDLLFKRLERQKPIKFKTPEEVKEFILKNRSRK